MPLTVTLTADDCDRLDLLPLEQVIEPLLKARSLAAHEQQLHFEVNYPREPGDPRELPEIQEIRLWFLRADARYPWLPFLLDWKAGELARYVAMLVPHQFHPKDGIQYNPEALELFVMHRLFILSEWMKTQGIEGRSRLKSMAQMFGYELDDTLFDLMA
jgi:hypothetical protein